MPPVIIPFLGTVLADDPSLNLRYQELLNSPRFDANLVSEEDLRQPIRIILDSNNQLSLQEKLFTLPGKVIIVSLIARDVSGFKQQTADEGG